MEEKLFTISDLKAAFIAGEQFEANTVSFNMGDIEAVTEPDFGDWMKETFEIEIN